MIKKLFQRTEPAGGDSEIHGRAVGLDEAGQVYLATGRGYLHWTYVQDGGETHYPWAPGTISEALAEAGESWNRLRRELGDDETWRRLVAFYGN